MSKEKKYKNGYGLVISLKDFDVNEYRKLMKECDHFAEVKIDMPDCELEMTFDEFIKRVKNESIPNI